MNSLRPYTVKIDLEIYNLLMMIQFLFSQNLKVTDKHASDYRNNARSLKLYDEQLNKLVNIKYSRRNLLEMKEQFDEASSVYEMVVDDSVPTATEKQAVIKFRRAFFEDEAKTIFTHFSTWGVEIERSFFKSPEINSAMWFTDYQFTGLLDKNGTEIYEGCIVKTGTDKLMVITWSKRFASFCIEREGWAFSHWFGEAFEANDCEVVGSVYENKDLIK